MYEEHGRFINSNKLSELKEDQSNVKCSCTGDNREI